MSLNRKRIWSVVFASPTSEHPYHNEPTMLADCVRRNVGTIYRSGFYTRQEAEDRVQDSGRSNTFWNFMAQKRKSGSR